MRQVFWMLTQNAMGGLLVVSASAMATVGCLSDIAVSRYRGHGEGDWNSPEQGTPSSTTTVTTYGALNFGPTQHQVDPPPPMSGGSIAITADSRTVVAADPDRDLIYVVDLITRVVRTVSLNAHDEPGRVALDNAGRAYVALRRGGAIVAIDLASASMNARTPVCPMPRGVAWDPQASLVRVACAGGELVSMGPSLAAPTTTRIEGLTDLRDVVILGKKVLVSTFRNAALLEIPTTTAGATSIDMKPTAIALPPLSAGVRHVAWRTMSAQLPTPGSGDEVVMIAQSAGTKVVEAPAQYYGFQSSGPGRSGATTVLTVGSIDVSVPEAVLPVDVAVSTTDVAIVSAGDAHVTDSNQIVIVQRPDNLGRTYQGGGSVPTPWGQVTSLAYTPDGSVLVALSRQPARLAVLLPPLYTEPTLIELSSINREDTGHAIFHANSGAGMACASCHPEGRDDGHAWTSAELGPRRTPSLLGTVANTAPYHWNGEAKNMRALAELTFTTRMRGPSLQTDQTDTLDQWLSALPPLQASPAVDTAAAARGKTLFESTAKCSTCHSGTTFTNNATVDVKTGGSFQVPSLVGVSHRAPYLHNGAAQSISQLLGNWQHNGAALTGTDISDIQAFLQTL